MHGRIRAVVTNLIKALFHSTLELVGSLGISISVEDTPGLKSWLGEHLGLDLSVQLTSTTFDVELVRCSTCICAHHEITSIVFVSWNLGWVFFECQVPLLLLLLALLVLSEGLEKVLAFVDFAVSVGVDDLGEILHEAEIGTHTIGESCELTELRYESYLVTSLPVFVDEKRLVWIFDALIVSGLVVVGIAHLLTVLIESGGWAHSEVNALHAIRLLVVPCDNGCSSEGKLNGFLPVSTSSLAFGLLTQFRDVLEN